MTVPAIPGPGEIIDDHCLSCGYALGGLSPTADGRCPECGQQANRMPSAETFVCEPAPLPDAPYPAARWLVVFWLVGTAGFAAFVTLSRIHMRVSVALALAPFAAGLVVALGWMPHLRPTRARGRVVVDCRNRTVRFEDLDLERQWKLPTSTGEGMAIRFEEILGVEKGSRGAVPAMLITTTRGRITVGSDFSNFAGLVAVVCRVAPHPPPWSLSKRRDRWLAATLIVLGAVVLVGLMAWIW